MLESPREEAPTITEIPWLSARTVLGGEASDFTPWLARPEGLQILGKALRLEDLTFVRSEHNVLGKRLDILARALDEDGEEIPICIENQYGETDANHLGRLIAYLAQEERGRAVWVVEDAHDAFVEAVRFLNRTATEDVGYYLVRVRFTAGLATSYHVFFEVLAAPSAYENRRVKTTSRLVNPEKVGFLEELTDSVHAGLANRGFLPRTPHSRGAYTRVIWPVGHWFRDLGEGFDISTTASSTKVVLYVEKFPTKEANVAAAEFLKERYEQDLSELLPQGTTVDWDRPGQRHRKPITFELPGEGYLSGDTAIAAAWTVSTCQALLTAFTTSSISDLVAYVETSAPDSLEE